MLNIISAIAIACLGVAQSQTQAAPPTPSPLAAAAAAAAAARGETKGTAGAGTPVALTFNWPHGLSATIETERSRTQTADGQTKSTGAAMRYRMHVAAHPEGRVISYDRFEPLRMALSPEQSGALEEILATMMPSLLVSTTGDFVKVTDATKMQAVMRALIDGVAAKGEPAPPNVKAMLDGLASEEVLNALASQEWQMFVGAWVGFEGRIGEMMSVDSDEPLPVMPGITVPMRSTFGALRLTPCEPGRAPDSCVVMQMRSAVAPGGMQALLQKLMAGAKGIERVSFERFDLTNDLQVTLEAATMKPYRITSTRNGSFSFRAEGESGSATQVEQRTYRITYH